MFIFYLLTKIFNILIEDFTLELLSVCWLNELMLNVFHLSSCEMQMLEFQVFNISEGTQPLKGHLPLTPGSNLTWFGFSEEGQLSSYDSKVC